MKPLAITIAILLSSAASFAKTAPKKQDTIWNWPTIEIADNYLLPCTSRRYRCGLLDHSGNVTPLPQVVRTIESDQFGWTAAIVTAPTLRSSVRKLIGPEDQIIPQSDQVQVVNFLSNNRAPVRFTSSPNDEDQTNPDDQLHYSFCTETGTLLETQFDQVSAFSNNVAAVRIGKQVGFIGLDGNFLPNSKKTECQFKNGLAEGYLAACLNGRWGYLGVNGNWLVKPIFDSAEPFHNGLAQVRVHSSTPTASCLSFIDRNGKLLEQRFYTTNQFEGDHAAVSVMTNELGHLKPRWGLIDKKGSWVLKPKYLSIGPLIGATRLIREGDLVGVIDKDGKVLVPPQYTHIGRFSDGLASFLSPASNKVGFIDQEGKTVIPAHFTRAGNFSEGLAAVQLDADSKIGFIDKGGAMVIEPKFDTWHSPMAKSVARGNGRSSSSLIDMEFTNGICRLMRSSKGKSWPDSIGYINKSGQWISSLVIEEGAKFNKGRALIRY